MTESKRSTILDSEDDAPDLSTPEWRAKFESVPLQRGLPAPDTPQVSTTIRLDADVIAHFKRGGEGWQARINDALRASMSLSERDRA